MITSVHQPGSFLLNQQNFRTDINYRFRGFLTGKILMFKANTKAKATISNRPVANQAINFRESVIISGNKELQNVTYRKIMACFQCDAMSVKVDGANGRIHPVRLLAAQGFY